MGRFCFVCSKPLGYRQRKYCSSLCRHKGNREEHKKRRETPTVFGESWIEHSEFPNIRVYKNGKITSRKDGKEIKPQETVEGYLRINTYNKSKGASCTTLVHRIVARVFIGESHLSVNHKDSNRKNNSLENLEYLEISENCRQAVRNGKYRQKITDEMLKIVFNLIESGKGELQIVKMTGININNINRIWDFYASHY